MALPDYLTTGVKYAGTDVIQKIQLGSGGIVDGVSGLAGRMDYIQTLALPVTAVANTDFTMSIPPGATLLSAVVYTSVAYTGATATIQIGNAAAGAQYVAAVSIAPIGIVNLTLLAAQTPALSSMPNASPNLFIRIVQTATFTAVGSAKLIINYVV